MERVTRSALTEEPATQTRSSFEAFFQAEHGRLFRALFLVTASSAEAEELMQEAFLKLWERWDRVASIEDPIGYLYRTAMNAFRSRERRAIRAARRVLTRAPAADDLAAIENRDAAARALRTLSPRQRAALVLTEYLGYSSDEAADVMGVKPATVRALTYQGRQALKGTSDE